MAKPGKNKKQCEKYRNSGHKEINAQLKKERAEKRAAKFAKRREDGKAYEYKPNPYKKGTKEYARERRERAAKNKPKKTEFERMKSIFTKLDNEISKQKKEEKASKSSGEKRGRKAS